MGEELKIQCLDEKYRASVSKSNVEVVRAFYEAEDVPAMLEFLDTGIGWQVPESLPWGGIFRGHEGFRGFSAIVTTQLAQARRDLDAGDRIVVLVHSGSRTGVGGESSRSAGRP